MIILTDERGEMLVKEVENEFCSWASANEQQHRRRHYDGMEHLDFGVWPGAGGFLSGCSFS